MASAGPCTPLLSPVHLIVPTAQMLESMVASGMRSSREQFVEETVDLTRRYKLEMLWIVDDNFMVDLDRAREHR